jgi:hypothetical protein
MPPESEADATEVTSWRAAELELDDARDELAASPLGEAAQEAYARLLAAQRGSTALVHAWLAREFQLERVADPRLVLSLDVDGVLEEETDGFSAAGVTGVAALRLLQLGRVAVLLNTGRSQVQVQERVDQFALLGGVASFGAAVWDAVFKRTYSLLSDQGKEQLDEFRRWLSAEPGMVLDFSYMESIRVSRLRDGTITPIGGPEARALLDQHGFMDLGFWVAPTHTDFVDRRADKATGLVRLRQELGLHHLPLAATGDGGCDVSTLRQASRAFIPAATLPSYVSSRHQRLVRSRYLGDASLWDVACRLVPETSLRRRVRSILEGLGFPEGFPAGSRRQPPILTHMRLPSWRLGRFLVGR